VPSLPRRTSARVLLLDEHDRVLMVKVRNDGAIVVPGSPAPPEFWVLVGGGVDPGESWEEAARREVFEETGLGEIDLGPCVWTLDREVLWTGRPVRIIERYFLARLPSGARTEIDRHGMRQSEHVAPRRYRWWSQEEMAAADGREAFRPPGLPLLLADVLRDPPERPLAL